MCVYSESQKAGKPKSNNGNGHLHSPMTEPTMDVYGNVSADYSPISSCYPDAGWDTTPTPPPADGGMSPGNLEQLHISTSPQPPPMGLVGLGGFTTDTALQELYSAHSPSWTQQGSTLNLSYLEAAQWAALQNENRLVAPGHNRNTPYTLNNNSLYNMHGGEYTLDDNAYNTSMTGTEIGQNNSWSPGQMVDQEMQPVFASPSQLPMYASASTSQFNGSVGTATRQTLPASSGTLGSCNCFRVCTEAIQSLHDADLSPNKATFDYVLKVTDKAIKGCSFMLECNSCMNRPGTDTALVLATVIGKVSSLYKAYSRPNQLSLGNHYTESILAPRLHNLNEVTNRFRDVCGNLSEDLEVSPALIGYVDRTVLSP